MITVSTLEPISKCFRPVHFTSKYTGKDFLLPCGKCDACRLAKDSKYSMLAMSESVNHRYALFFTLTYDNLNVPAYCYSDDSFLYSDDYVRLYNNRDGSSLNVYKRDFRGFDFSVYNVPSDVCFPVVSVVDVQKFFKRLRINIVRKVSKNIKIKYFISSEYGPKTFRPHYHGIIYFDDSRLIKSICYAPKSNCTLLAYLISKSWPFADFARTAKYSSIVSGGAINYASSYMQKVDRLPLATLRISALIKFKRRKYTKMSVKELMEHLERMLSQKVYPLFLSPRRFEIDFSLDFRFILASLLRYNVSCIRCVSENPLAYQSLIYHYLKSRYMMPV